MELWHIPWVSLVNRTRWASNIHAPVMLVDGILLIHIDVEEFVVALALGILVALKSNIRMLTIRQAGGTPDLRVQLF